MHPVLIQIGPLEIRWYGAMIALACLVGYWLAGREAERKGIGKEKFQEFFLYVFMVSLGRLLVQGFIMLPLAIWRYSGKIRFRFWLYGKAGWLFTVPCWAGFWSALFIPAGVVYL
jgi:hypothetical protein